MPEGDTVYRLAQRLRAALDGEVLTSSDFRVPAHATATLVGARVVDHDTHGKHLLTRFDNGWTLHTHLRMTGSWTVTRAGRQLPRRVQPDVRVRMGVASGVTAWGLSLPVVMLLRTSNEHEVIGHLGPDPLRADWDAAAAIARLSADRNRPVAAALLDQTLIAGLGNLWANELCFLRGLHPDTPVGEVDVARLVALARRALVVSATQDGAMQVTTGDPRRGRQHYVAGRAHQPCLRCGTPIEARDEQRSSSGRRTWWCPSCQPASAPIAAGSQR